MKFQVILKSSMQIFELLLLDGSAVLGSQFCNSEKWKGLVSILSQLGVYLCIRKTAVFKKENPTCSMRAVGERVPENRQHSLPFVPLTQPRATSC